MDSSRYRGNRHQGNGHRGFSLLELLVILVLVALVSATVVVRWSGVQQDAVLQAAVGQLEFNDAYLRRHARSHGTPCRLAFDLKEHRLRKQYRNESQENPPWKTLGRGIQIRQLQINHASAQKNQFEVMYQRDGTSVTYGLELVGPRGQKTWLIVAGITGQITRLATQKEYEDAFQIVSPRP